MVIRLLSRAEGALNTKPRLNYSLSAHIKLLTVQQRRD